MNAKITFPELVDMVADATSSNRRVSELFLKELFATISQALIEGENVTVKGLGTFRLARVAARRIVSVSTGDLTEVPSHNKLVFDPDKKLADELNQPFAQFETIVLDDSITDEMIMGPDNPVDDEPSQDEIPVQEPEVEPAPAQAVCPPPFRPSALMKAAPDPVPAPTATLAPEPAPSAVPVAEAPAEVEPEPSPSESIPNVQETESAPIVQEQESEQEQEQEISPRDYTLAQLQQEQRQAVRQATRKGFLWGALSMLALCAFAWWALSIKGGHAEPAQVISDTLVNDSAQASDVAKEATAPPLVTDTVSPTNYLTKMAVKHYGKQDFWVYIYEENKDKISNPNAVPPGTVLVIPPADKYGIDPADKTSVETAKKKSFELFSKFK